MDTLAELNSLFTAWVEQVYHQRVHSETGQAPLARLLAAGPPVPTPAELLTEAFRWGEWRTVGKTATVSLHGNLYEVDRAFAGSKVELVFDPFDLTDITVRHHGRPAGRPSRTMAGRPSQGRRRHPATGAAHRDRLPAAARGTADPALGERLATPNSPTDPARAERTDRCPSTGDRPRRAALRRRPAHPSPPTPPRRPPIASR